MSPGTVAITKYPPGATHEAIRSSAAATSRWSITSRGKKEHTASKPPASAAYVRTSACSNRACGTRERARSTMCAETSMPVTAQPARASASAVGRPVPLPTSSTRAPGASRAVSQSSAASCPGTRPNTSSYRAPSSSNTSAADLPPLIGAPRPHPRFALPAARSVPDAVEFLPGRTAGKRRTRDHTGPAGAAAARPDSMVRRSAVSESSQAVVAK